MTKSARLSILTFALFISIAGYFYYVLPSCAADQTACFDAQSAPLAPYRYRLLQPALDLVAGVQTNEQALAFGTLIHTALLALFVPCVYLWLRRWTNDDRAVIGVLITTLLLMLAYRIYFRNIATLIETLCLTTSLLLVNKRLIWQVGLLVVASLNRETGFFLVLFYIAYNGLKWDWRYLVLALTYGAVTFAIHLAMGAADHVLGLVGTLNYNLSNWAEDIFTAILFLPLIVLAVISFRRAPPILQRLTLVAVLFVGANLAGGAINEFPRLMLPVIVICLPMMVQGRIYPRSTEREIYRRQVADAESNYRGQIKAFDMDALEQASKTD